MAFSHFFRIFCDFLKEGKVKKEKARRAAENREQGLTDLPFCGKIMRVRDMDTDADLYIVPRFRRQAGSRHSGKDNNKEAFRRNGTL